MYQTGVQTRGSCWLPWYFWLYSAPRHGLYVACQRGACQSSRIIYGLPEVQFVGESYRDCRDKSIIARPREDACFPRRWPRSCYHGLRAWRKLPDLASISRYIFRMLCAIAETAIQYAVVHTVRVEGLEARDLPAEDYVQGIRLHFCSC